MGFYQTSGNSAPTRDPSQSLAAPNATARGMLQPMPMLQTGTAAPTALVAQATPVQLLVTVTALWPLEHTQKENHRVVQAGLTARRPHSGQQTAKAVCNFL